MDIIEGYFRSYSDKVALLSCLCALAVWKSDPLHADNAIKDLPLGLAYPNQEPQSKAFRR